MPRPKKKTLSVGQFFSKAKEPADPKPPPPTNYLEMNPKQKKAKRQEMRSVGIQKKREYLLKKKFGLDPHENAEKAAKSLIFGRPGAKARNAKLAKIQIILENT